MKKKGVYIIINLENRSYYCGEALNKPIWSQKETAKQFDEYVLFKMLKFLREKKKLKVIFEVI